MSWYSESGEAFPFRAAVALDYDLGALNSTDFTITVPVDFERFWANIQATGDDIRITDAIGLTKLTYQLQAFTLATRTCIIEIQGLTPSQINSATIVFLYWGDDDVASGAGSFTASTPRSGYVMVGGPAPDATTFIARAQNPGDTVAAEEISKTTGESFGFWWDISQILNSRQTPYNARTMLEEVKSIVVEVETGGTPSGALFDVTKSRLVSPGLVRVWLQAGVDATEYIVITKIEITDGQDARIRDLRTILKVNDPTE